MLKAALREFTLVHAMSAARRQVAADLWIKPIGLIHKPACRLPVNYTHNRHFFIIRCTQPESWYSFHHPTEGRRLSRPSWLADSKMKYVKRIKERFKNRLRIITIVIRDDSTTTVACHWETITHYFSLAHLVYINGFILSTSYLRDCWNAPMSICNRHTTNEQYDW